MMKALIADHSAISRQLLRNAFERWGCEVVCAADGAQALAMLVGCDPPDMAVLDWMMPKVNGLDVCRAVRRLYPRGRPYLVLLVPRDLPPGEAVDCLRDGAHDYLAKPFDVYSLRACVQDAEVYLQL